MFKKKKTFELMLLTGGFLFLISYSTFVGLILNHFNRHHITLHGRDELFRTFA